MNRAQRRIVDPILSNVALGYEVPEHVGFELFPAVPVDMKAGKIIKWGKEAFSVISSIRAPGALTKRIKVGYSNDNYSTTNHALDAVIPKEHLKDAERIPGIQLQSQAVQTVMQIERNNLELEHANLARNAGGYDPNSKVALTTTDKWSDYTNSDPIRDVKEAKAAVRRKTGREPNKMVIPADVWDVLCEHPKLLEKLPNNDIQILSRQDLQRIFDIPRVVKAMSMLTDEEGDFYDVWATDVVLAVVPEVITGRAQQSYGYTYTLKGHPSVEAIWYDRTIKSYVNGVEYERAPLLTSIQSGFLFQNPI